MAHQREHASNALPLTRTSVLIFAS